MTRRKASTKYTEERLLGKVNLECAGLARAAKRGAPFMEWFQDLLRRTDAVAAAQKAYSDFKNGRRV